MEWVAIFHLPEVFFPSSPPLNFSLARTWRQDSRWESHLQARAELGQPESLFDLLWLLTGGGPWRVRRHSWSLASPLFARKKDPVFEMEYQGVAAGWESSEIVWGILKVHGNGSVWSICSVYWFCFCVIQDGNKGGRAGNSNSLFFTQGRIC